MKVLWASDGSENSRAVGKLLNQLLKERRASVYVLVVAPATPLTPWADPSWFALGSLGDFEEAVTRAAAEMSSDIAATLDLPDAEITILERRGTPADQIIQAAEHEDVDLIALGAKGHTGLEGFLLGSVANAVVKKAPTSVLVGRDTGRAVTNLILPTDGSDHAQLAEAELDELNLTGVTVHVLTCVPPLVLPYSGVGIGAPVYSGEAVQAMEDAEVKAARDTLGASRARLEAKGYTVTEVLSSGRPADEITVAAEELPAELIVIGSRGRSGIKRALLGSVAGEVANDAPCSVLISRKKAAS